LRFAAAATDGMQVAATCAERVSMPATSASASSGASVSGCMAAA
jgi:hypothetical protein